MSDRPDLGALYRLGRDQVTDLVRGLSGQQLATSVPACPGWTVHGVVSHLAGVASDIVNGRLDGMPTPEHTHGQVADRASMPTPVVVREWERTSSQLEILLTKSDGRRFAPVADVAVHEQDIRGAVDQPGNRDGPLVDFVIDALVPRFLSKAESAGLAPVRISDLSGASIAGPDDAPVDLRMSRFELFRAMFGRRSRAQIEKRLTGATDPGAYVSLLAVFGPTDEDIVE